MRHSIAGRARRTYSRRGHLSMYVSRYTKDHTKGSRHIRLIDLFVGRFPISAADVATPLWRHRE